MHASLAVLPAVHTWSLVHSESIGIYQTFRAMSRIGMKLAVASPVGTRIGNASGSLIEFS